MRTYTIVVEPEETGGFMVSVPALPGCFTQGRSIEECRERAAEAIAAGITTSNPDADVLELQSNAESKATYSIDYVSGILKALSAVADTVELEYSTKKPLRLMLKLNDQGAKMWYFLAPRVSD